MREGEREIALFRAMVPWCSGLAYVPVKDEIAGSNPVGTARLNAAAHNRGVVATSVGRMGGARQIVVAVVGFALVLGIWWADGLTPDDFRFGFLYMFPIAGVAWWGPRRAALACAALAAICLVSNDLAAGPAFPPSALVWNEFTRIVTMFAVALLIIYVRVTSERVRSYSEQAFRMAITDPLTGLYNRRYLDDQLARIHATATRAQRPYAVVALDIDDFKLINDTYGHTKGDAALVMFAQDLRRVIRAGDIAVRTGGDEFVVVLSEATAAEATTLAKRLQRTLAERKSPQEVRSVSAGVVEWRSTLGPDGLLAEADQLVYQSKRVGGGSISTPATAL